jgi:uncharacterized membrane protein YgcG
MIGGSDAHPFLSIAAVSALAVTQAAPLAASTLPVQYQQAQGDVPPNCRAFTAAVMIGGQPQQAVGQACQQPDGSWRITESAPGQPPLAYTLPPEAIYAPPYPYPYYWDDPWIFGAPFFVGGSLFFGDRFHRRDGFRHFEGFHRDFHHGFGRNFDGRFHGGGFHGGGFHGGGFHGGGFHGGGFHGGGFHGGGFHGGGHGGHR